MQTVKVKCPGTIANLVCGFDVLGLAVVEPYDILELRLINENKIYINNIDHYGLPTDPQKNVVGVVLKSMMDALPNEQFGFEANIEKRIKPGSGIGSSAASAAGAAFAANLLLGNRYSKEELVKFAMEGEALASGARHADNIAPCLFGGITLIRSNIPLDIIPLTSPELYITLVHPQIEVKTIDARRILKKEVPLKAAIRQWGNVAGLVAGFLKNDLGLIGRSLQDEIIEPVRSILIPGFSEVKQKSLEAGALGGGISGAGPSIFMLSISRETAQAVAREMSGIYENMGIDCNIYITQLNKNGVELMD